VRKDRRLTKEQLAPFMLELGHVEPRPPGAGGESVRPLPEVASPPLHFPTLFGNDNPVEVEVGFGKGLFLVSSGEANPHVNYFGIEWIRKYQLYATTRAAVRNLTNVRTCCADAKLVLRDHIPAGSVRTVHVFFPDPWWKNRHKKRLLFTPDFAESVLRVLQPGGVLHFVTDVADYFEWVTGTLTGIPQFQLLPPPAENSPQHDMDYLTNFERKFRKEGRPIYRSRYSKSCEGASSK
jgi:tRNA (guanine-N7-)-methyltransferase